MRIILPHNIIRYNYYKNLHHMPTNVVGNWFTWQTHLPGHLAEKTIYPKSLLTPLPPPQKKKKTTNKKVFSHLSWKTISPLKEKISCTDQKK